MRFLIVSLFCGCVWGADNMPPEAEQRLAREIYKQMIEVKSGFTTGATTPIAESVAARFKAAGFPASDIFVGGAIPTKANVVVRYPWRWVAPTDAICVSPGFRRMVCRDSFRTAMTCARTDAMSVCSSAHFTRARPSSTSSSKLCLNEVGFSVLAGFARSSKLRKAPF